MFLRGPGRALRLRSALPHACAPFHLASARQYPNGPTRRAPTCSHLPASASLENAKVARLVSPYAWPTSSPRSAAAVAQPRKASILFPAREGPQTEAPGRSAISPRRASQILGTPYSRRTSAARRVDWAGCRCDRSLLADGKYGGRGAVKYFRTQKSARKVVELLFSATPRHYSRSGVVVW